MIKYLIKIPFFIGGLLLFITSCEKVIDVELDTSPNQIVIEGNITDQLGQQTIRISRSVPYTDSNVYPAVSGAAVTVKDEQGQLWNFTETKPGLYTSGPLKGQAGSTYTLTAKVNNTVYTASSTMPQAVKLDSLSYKVFTFFGEESREIEVSYKDPADVANQYRYMMRINGRLVKQIFVENDRLTNGKSGARPLFHNSEKEQDKIKLGDQVEIEMQCIDKQTYVYWYTLSQQLQNGPGGGVTPANPPSNINNNALGYFSAHSSEVKTITIEKAGFEK